MSDTHDKMRQRVCMDAYEELAAMRSPRKGAARMEHAMQIADAAWRNGISETEWRSITLARLTP